MCGSTRRQLLLAGAALPVLPYLPRSVPTVALGSLDVQPRAAWGADLKPTGPLSEEAPGDVRFLLVHHSASANGYSRAEAPKLLRSFYGLHTKDRKWPDIAYNFLVDRFGQVWEGRTGSLGGPVKGDATGGSQGFALLTCFIGDHTKEPPSPEAEKAMAKLLGILGARHGLDLGPEAKASFVSRGSSLHAAGTQVTTPTIAAHRDMSKTTCPGDACYRLVRSRLAPAAAVAAASAGGAVAIPGGTVPPGTAAPPPSAPAETLPPANPGGAPLDTTPPTLTPPATTFLGGAGRAGDDEGAAPGLWAGAAGGAVLAAGGLLALVLRRRGNAKETGHWEQARARDEPQEPRP